MQAARADQWKECLRAPATTRSADLAEITAKRLAAKAKAEATAAVQNLGCAAAGSAAPQRDQFLWRGPFPTSGSTRRRRSRARMPADRTRSAPPGLTCSLACSARRRGAGSKAACRSNIETRAASPASSGKDEPRAKNDAAARIAEGYSTKCSPGRWFCRIASSTMVTCWLPTVWCNSSVPGRRRQARGMAGPDTSFSPARSTHRLTAAARKVIWSTRSAASGGVTTTVDMPYDDGCLIASADGFAKRRRQPPSRRVSISRSMRQSIHRTARPENRRTGRRRRCGIEIFDFRHASDALSARTAANPLRVF